MAITGVGDVFIPEVVADITSDILMKEKKLLNSPYVVDGTTQMYRDGGSDITFPYFETGKGIVQDQVTNSRTGVTPSEIKMGFYKESVINRIISFDHDENAFEDILQTADPNQHIAEIVADEYGDEIQERLIQTAMATPLLYKDVYEAASNNTLSVDSISDCKLMWGDKSDSRGIPGLFVHSDQEKALKKSDDFKSLGTATLNNPLVNAQAQNGAFALVHGVLLYSLDTIVKKGGTVSSITRASQVATVTTAAAHNYVVGDTVVISGATQTEYNGTFTIASVPSTTTFTYTVSGSPATPATGSTAIATSYESLMLLPGALMMVIKKGITPKTHDHAGSEVITQDFKFRYATTLKRIKPRPAIRFRTR